MNLMRRSFLLFGIIALAVGLVGFLAPAQTKAPSKTLKKIENTDTAQRLKWFEQHQAMKEQSPFKDLKWRFIGPADLGGRCTDIAVPKGSRTVIYIAAATGGLWKTVNAGITWEPLFEDMPTQSIGDIAVAESDPNVVWVGTGEANIFRASEPGMGVFKSTDGGKTWKPTGLEGTYTIGRIVIHPTNPDIVYVAATGHEWTYNPDRGVFKTSDGGKAWRDFHRGIPSVQFYNVAYDFQSPFWVYGSVQDQGTYRGQIPLVKPGQAAQGRRMRFGRPEPKWETAPGGEGTLIAVDPADSDIEYASTFYGRLQRSEYKNGTWESKDIYPKAAKDEPEYRGQWLAATMLSPHNPLIVYHGFQYLFRSMDRGDTWERISPDLTYNNPEQQGKWPFAIPFATITAVDESPFKFGVLYAGTDDGRVWVTKVCGEAWTEITSGLPFNKHVWKIVASKYDPATVYVTLVGRHDDDFNPYIFKSADYGKTWTSIAGGIPGGPVNAVREDPKTKDILYAGTDTGIYVSLDGGKTWNVLGSGLPTTYVWDIAVHPRDNCLIVATNGRGMWIIDDIAPVQNAVK